MSFPNEPSGISIEDRANAPSEGDDRSLLFSPIEVRLPMWRFWVPLLLQIGFILAVPAPAVYTHITGKTAILQTEPVDPYDFLRGYYQVLSYDISNQATLQRLPGWNKLPGKLESCPPGINKCKPRYLVESGTNFYVVLEAPKNQVSVGRPQPWKPVRVSLERPQDLPTNQIALQGNYNGWQARYGLETYYMPEAKQAEVNTNIREAQAQQRQALVVEVKVGANGHAVPVSLWVRDRNYKF